MKSVFHLVLCAYLLILSVLPCADSLGLLRWQKPKTTISADAHQHPVHQANGDACSPFCACSCCGTVLDTPPQFQFAYLHNKGIQTACFAPVNETLSSLALPSWQPPHIG